MKNIFTLALILFLTGCSLSSEYPLYKPSTNKPMSKITFDFDSAYGELGIYTFLNSNECQVKRLLARLKGDKKKSIKMLPSGQKRAINMHFYHKEGRSRVILPILIKLKPKIDHEYKIKISTKKENNGIRMKWIILEKYKNRKYKKISLKRYKFSLMPYGDDEKTWKHCPRNVTF